jgi:biotin transport system substrate-specific component
MRTSVGTTVIQPAQTVVWMRNALLAVGASLFVAACAQVAVPLIASPVPVSLANFAVLLVGMVLGPRFGAAALALYLMEGASGLPFFAPTGPGGIAQLFGPTGGFLMAYPAVAAIAGYGFRRFGGSFKAALASAAVAELALFVAGTAWLMIVTAAGVMAALQLAVLPFVPGEVLKVFAASAIASRWRRFLNAKR